MAQRMLDLPEGQSLYKGYSDAWKKCSWNEASCTIKEHEQNKYDRLLVKKYGGCLRDYPGILAIFANKLIIRQS